MTPLVLNGYLTVLSTFFVYAYKNRFPDIFPRPNFFRVYCALISSNTVCTVLWAMNVARTRVVHVQLHSMDAKKYSRTKWLGIYYTRWCTNLLIVLLSDFKETGPCTHRSRETSKELMTLSEDKTRWPKVKD